MSPSARTILPYTCCLGVVLFIYVTVLWDRTQGPAHAGQEEPDTPL